MISEKAAGIAPYTAGEQPRGRDYIKLNTNENPYPPGDKVISALRAADFSRLRLYPDPDAALLREAAAREHGLLKENVFCGNGSDEVLALCFQAFYNPAAEPVYFPDVTYSFYPVWCSLYGINYKTLPLSSDFSLLVRDYLDRNDGQGVVLANPNAPTGRALPLSDIERIAAANRGKAVIIDEAYVAFGGETAVPLIKKYDNVCVVRTFSKSYSLAGIRAGYALAGEKLIGALKKIKDSFNSYPLDMLAQAAAAAALADGEYYGEQTAKVIRTRERFAGELRAAGFDVVPSAANFVFASHKRMKAEDIYLKLKERGVLVRWFNKPRISNFLRISVGTDGEMDDCAALMTEIVRS